MIDRRLLWILAAATALVALFVLLRPAADDGGAGPAGATTTTAAATGEPTTPTLEPIETDTVRATVVVRGGRPEGGLARVQAKQGQTVILFFRSDEPDEIHVHGYDVAEPVGPGDVARIVLSADKTGRFEIEFHDYERQVAQLTVTP